MDDAFSLPQLFFGFSAILRPTPEQQMYGLSELTLGRRVGPWLADLLARAGEAR